MTETETETEKKEQPLAGQTLESGSVCVNKSEHFTKHVGQWCEKIKAACGQIAGQPAQNGAKKFDPYKWVQAQVKQRGHPGAICEAICGMAKLWTEIKEPWAYGRAVMKTINGNWHEKDAIAIHEQLKCMTPAELTAISHGLFKSI